MSHTDGDNCGLSVSQPLVQFSAVVVEMMKTVERG